MGRLSGQCLVAAPLSARPRYRGTGFLSCVEWSVFVPNIKKSSQVKFEIKIQISRGRLKGLIFISYFSLADFGKKNEFTVTREGGGGLAAACDCD